MRFIVLIGLLADEELLLIEGPCVRAGNMKSLAESGHFRCVTVCLTGHSKEIIVAGEGVFGNRDGPPGRGNVWDRTRGVLLEGRVSS